MINWGYENYLRKHTIQLGFTPEFVRNQPDRLKAFPHSTRQSFPRVILPAHVLARQTRQPRRAKDPWAPESYDGRKKFARLSGFLPE
jgi:hypothetical protein